MYIVHVGITIECRTRKSLKQSPKCFELPDSANGHAHSHVITSNNIVVALTINDDHEGVGLKTENSLTDRDTVAMGSNKNRVALIMIETEGIEDVQVKGEKEWIRREMKQGR